jgi:hypothetical protein
MWRRDVVVWGAIGFDVGGHQNGVAEVLQKRQGEAKAGRSEW